MKNTIILLLLSLIFIISCGEIDQKDVDLHNKLFQFKVEVINSPNTSQENPADVPYYEGDFQVKIKVTALDFYNKVIDDFKNDLRIYTSTGTTAPSNISKSLFNHGVATLTVSLIKTYDKSFIVVEDANNGVIGVSDKDKRFFFKGLDIYDIQLPSNDTVDATNFFNDSYVRISQNIGSDGIADKNLMVIYASGSGMYIIDLDKLHVDGTGDNTGACMIKDGTGNWIKNPNFIGYSTIYVYSRNAPINFDGDTSVGAGEEDFKYLRAGHKLDWFAGNLVEFPPGIPNGMTEMGFPLWQMISGEMTLDSSILDERMKNVPICQFDHSDFVAGRGDSNNIKKMERYEANLVEIKDVEIGEFDADNKDYKIYSQWQVYPTGTDPTSSDKPTFRVVSINGASEFDLMFHKKLVTTCKDVWHSNTSDITIDDAGDDDDDTYNCSGKDYNHNIKCKKNIICSTMGTCSNINLCERVIHKGTEISYIKGVLHQVYSDIWVIYLRSKCDIKLKDDNLGGWNTMIANDPECNK